MKKLLYFLKTFFTEKENEQTSLERLASKKEAMEAELDTLSRFENLLKQLNQDNNPPN